MTPCPPLCFCIFLLSAIMDIGRCCCCFRFDEAKDLPWKRPPSMKEIKWNLDKSRNKTKAIKPKKVANMTKAGAFYNETGKSKKKQVSFKNDLTISIPTELTAPLKALNPVASRKIDSWNVTRPLRLRKAFKKWVIDTNPEAVRNSDSKKLSPPPLERELSDESRESRKSFVQSLMEQKKAKPPRWKKQTENQKMTTIKKGDALKNAYNL